MERHGLTLGNCNIKEHDDRFVKIEQNGRTFHCSYRQSQDAEFIVAWSVMLDFVHEKSNQVCLIENGRQVLWSKEFRRAISCFVSNNGTVAVQDLYPTPINDANGRPGLMFVHSIAVIPRDGNNNLKLDFGLYAEIMAFALSPDGRFLIYNLQRYKPKNYELVLHNLETNKEEWRYKYPPNQVIHELAFKEQCVLVYSGPRPSAYVDRRYGFTLDLAGRLVEDDVAEKQKQKEKDSIAASADDAADKVIQIMTKGLRDVAPTIEATKISQAGTKLFSPAMTSIMAGRMPLPAINVLIRPELHKLQFQEDKANTEEKGYQFFLHLEIVARNPEERATVIEKCLQTLDQKAEELQKDSLAITTTPRPRIIDPYPGSGSYPRADINFMVAFPSKQQPRKGGKFEEVFKLQVGESVITMNDVLVRTGGIRIEGKLVLTTEKLYLFLKNPVSGRFSTTSGFSPEKAKKMSFGEDGGKYLQRNEIRVYFKDQEGEFENFKRKFESWIR